MRRDLGIALLALAACGTPTRDPDEAAVLRARDLPNIVVVMTDDQGYGDFGCHQNPVLQTPRLDAFAAECPDVARFYVSPVCSPTRASLMTGRYNYRTRVVDTWLGRSMMEPAERTIAEVLRHRGYRTGIFGKWHLGDCYPTRPQDQGFDEVLVHRGGGLAQPSEPVENGRAYTDPILFDNGEQVRTEGYCTEVYFDRALRFMDTCRAERRPFFAYIATNAPHGPLHDVPQDLYAKYRDMDLSGVLRGSKPDAVARVFAMIEDVDRQFGRMLDHLTEQDLERDTIVVFLSDNGPTPGRYNRGLRGHKSTVFEGGVRAPLWVRWPGRLSPATHIAAPAAHIDLLPTLCDMAGVAAPTHIDGRSLYPLLRGDDQAMAAFAERNLFLQSHRGDAPEAGHNCAVIGPRFKLVRASGFGQETAAPATPWQLFDLTADPGEQRDVAAANPEVTARLRSAYDRWFEDVSHERRDNFAPPRIRVGTMHEAVTVLTHQDWRPTAGGGWGTMGKWLLQVDAPRTFDVTLVFPEERVLEKVTFHTGRDEPLLEHMVLENDRFDYGPIEFGGGDIEFWVSCGSRDGPFAPYQVELRSR